MLFYYYLQKNIIIFLLILNLYKVHANYHLSMHLSLNLMLIMICLFLLLHLRFYLLHLFQILSHFPPNQPKIVSQFLLINLLNLLIILSLKISYENEMIIHSYQYQQSFYQNYTSSKYHRFQINQQLMFQLLHQYMQNDSYPLLFLNHFSLSFINL